MNKNIFITGDIKVGKSTLLDNCIKNFSGKISGFKTLPKMVNNIRSGFVILPYEYEESSIPDQYIAKFLADGNLVLFSKTFDTIGVKILDKCLEEKPDLIIMDELGFFESYSTVFQNKIYQCLDSSLPVLGVIKPANIPFLNSIRKRKDVTIIEINKNNRDNQHIFLQEMVKKLNKCQIAP